MLSGVFWLALFLILRTQTLHPWNPEGFHSGTWDVTFNTVSSFVTNTNWQFYGGETTMTYFSQMAGLAVQNFVSAAVGIVVAIALIRGDRAPPRCPARRPERTLGNFWVDLTRALFYVLLPISIVGALVLVSQGVVQALGAYVDLEGIAGGGGQLALGPVASQEVIKELGTNGGGFFNVNSAMPFENPNGISNFLEMLPDPRASRPRSPRRTAGWSARAARAGDLRRDGDRSSSPVSSSPTSPSSTARPPSTPPASHGRLRRHDGRQPRGQGAALRHRRTRASGPSSTTVTSCGAVNAAIESLTGFGGLVPFANLVDGETIFGGVGTGLYSMLLFVLLAVFIGGLMVGRTPEYLGKKIEAREIKLVALGTLFTPLTVLIAGGLAHRDEVRRAVDRRLGPAGLLGDALRLRRRRPTTTARRSRATPATSSPSPATSAPSASPSPT